MFQNTSNDLIHLKKGQILGRATTGATGHIFKTPMEVDWSDLMQPEAQERFLGPTTPIRVSTEFYDRLVLGTFQTLDDELDFLVSTIHHTERDIGMPSESFSFNASGKELPRAQSAIGKQAVENHPPHSISESELLQKISLAPRRKLGEVRDAEDKDETPHFAPIPNRRPNEPIEEIFESDIKLGPGLTDEQ